MRRANSSLKLNLRDLWRVIWGIGFGLVGLVSVCEESEPEGAVTKIIELRDASFGALHEKARSGKSITILSLGGSITQSDRGHSRLIPDWFRNRYPGAEVLGVNGGLSSTCSHTGAFRMQTLVDSHGPIDLLVVEYAVNDDQDAAHDYAPAVRGMEGIIRRARTEGMAVLLVLYANEALLSSVRRGVPSISMRAHLAVAARYGIPTVNIPAALVASEETGRFSWEDYGGVHPNSAGYSFAMEWMTRALAALLDKPPLANADFEGKPLDPLSYDAGHWVEPSEAVFEGNWAMGHPTREQLPLGGVRSAYFNYPLARSSDVGATARLGFEGNAISVFVLAGPDAGTIGIKVDGIEVGEIDLYHRYSQGLNYPRTVVLADGLTRGPHEVTVTILESRNTMSQGHAVNLLYWGVNHAHE